MCKKGNVREVHHHYYSTPQWHREGQWADCQANDVRRALVSYLNLIRRAFTNTETFDQQFVRGSSPLSQVYWRFMAEPVSANELQEELIAGHRNTSVDGFESCPYPQYSFFWPFSKPLLARLVGLELRWSTVPSKWQFWTS